MKRETFILIVAFMTVVLGGCILMGNRGYMPDYSFYIYPFFIAGFVVIMCTHPISKLYHWFQVRHNK